jgi:hypothetical protein
MFESLPMTYKNILVYKNNRVICTNKRNIKRINPYIWSDIGLLCLVKYRIGNKMQNDKLQCLRTTGYYIKAITYYNIHSQDI